MKIKRIVFFAICSLLSFLSGYHLAKNKYEYIYVEMAPEINTNINIKDPLLIESIIEVESLHNPKAVSSKGCIGLMQVNYQVWKKDLLKLGITKEDLFKPEKNILAGKYILEKHYRFSKGDLRKTLQGYSGGAKWYYERVMTAYIKRKENNYK